MKVNHSNNYCLAQNIYKSDNSLNIGQRGNYAVSQSIQTSQKPYSDINFTGIHIQPKTTAYMTSTYKKTKELYKQYRASLSEVSLQDIRKIADNIAETTGNSRENVLTAMQKLTQFANMRSIRNISDVLAKHKISLIGNTSFSCETEYLCTFHTKKFNSNAAREAVCNDIGLHNTLDYLLTRKGFGELANPHKSYKIAVFLDETKISQFEKFKKENPEEFKKYIKSNKLNFYFISGWDNGITIANRNKNLEAETRKLLKYAKKENISIDEAIDYENIQRIKQLGINPTIIRTEGNATDSCIYRQMTPEKMSENEFFNLIDSNSQMRSNNNIVKAHKHKEAAVKYLQGDMTIYTPERMSKLIENLHKQVTKYASKRNIAPENILYVEPHNKKSYCLINYYYEKVNNIPHEQFITLNQAKNPKTDLNGKLLVFLDDCTITGDSIEELMTEINYSRSKEIKKTPKLFACMSGTIDAEERLCHKGRKNIIIQDYINFEKTTKKHLVNRNLEKSVGCSSFTGGDATCLVFPYMSPDNNTEIGANIALLHNTQFRTRNLDKNGQIRHQGIKNYSENVNDVAVLYKKMIGLIPSQTDKTLQEITKENPITFKEKIKDFISNFF